MRSLGQAGLVLGCLVLGGCSSSALESSKSTPSASVVPAAIELLALYDAPPSFHATALAFDPLRSGELWVTLRQARAATLCLKSSDDSCPTLEGQVALVQGATSATPRMALKKDGNAWHFMRRPTSIAFGDNGNFSTCGEARTDNFEDESIDYSGPVLWSSDPAIFGAKPGADQNGTHLDMLHESPLCMGVAFEHDNAYWVFNGQLGAIDRYDFRAPHVIGGADHADGELHRYLAGELERVPEIPSHLVLDRARGELYVADTGHGRVLRLAIDSGTPGADVIALDPIKVHRQVDDALFEEFVPPGTIAAPSGIALSGDRVIVTDNATNQIFWFERDGSLVASRTVDLPAGSLGGVSVGPDNKLYLSDLKNGAAYRVEERR